MSNSKTFIEKLDEIQSGWKNWIWKNKEVEMVALRRATICAGCPSNVSNVCKECGCPLFAKTRSMKETNKCDLNKWQY